MIKGDLYLKVTETLVQFGYSKLIGSNWVKPMGFNLFAFNTVAQCWVNFAQNNRGRISIRGEFVFGHFMDEPSIEQFVQFIKESEASATLVKPDSSKYETVVMNQGIDAFDVYQYLQSEETKAINSI